MPTTAQGLAQAGLPGRAAEDFAAHRLTDHAHSRARRLLFVVEEAPGGQLPIAGDEPGMGAAGHGGGPVAPIGDHGDAGTPLGRHGGHAADLRGDGLGIGLRERRHTARAAAAAAGPALAGHDQQQIGAQAGDLGFDGLCGAVAQRDHGDHRRHADHDAQDGQEGAQQVAPYRAQGEQAHGREHVRRFPSR
jgi:hypothetical protein